MSATISGSFQVLMVPSKMPAIVGMLKFKLAPLSPSKRYAIETAPATYGTYTQENAVDLDDPAVSAESVPAKAWFVVKNAVLPALEPVGFEYVTVLTDCLLLYAAVAFDWNMAGNVAPVPTMSSADAVVATDMLPTTTSAVDAIILRKLFMNSSKFFRLILR
jgi:hypothetical protein